MMISGSTKITIGTIILLGGGGAVILISTMGPFHKPAATQQIVVGMPPSPPVIHSAEWYVAHPDVLQVDEQRCAGNATTIPQAACQNAASADAQLAGADYAKAAATFNNQASASSPKTQTSP
jgi:hypothetical protein